jgi:uncharacterized protein YggE
MNPKIKDVLGGAAVIALVAFAYAGVLYAKSVQPNAYRDFTVSADSKVVAVPDVAMFTFSVISEGGKDLKSLQKDNTDRTNKVIDFLKENKIDAKDIKTEGYDVSPRYQSYSCSSSVNGMGSVCPPATIVGYTITQTVSVKARDFSKVGDALGGVVDKGANNVSSLSFTIDDPDKLQGQAREEAIAKAKDKAEAIAKAGGFHLGKLVAIDEGSSPIYYDKVGYGMGADARLESQTSAAPAVEPGSQDVSITVTLRYEIR